MKADEELRMNVFRGFSVARHTVLKELFDSLFEGAANADGNLGEEIGIEFGTVDHYGNEGTMSLDEAMEGIQKTGIYGYVDEKERVIHVWFDGGKISFEGLLFFFGHEIGHTIKELELPDGYDFDEETTKAYLEEMRADGYAFAAKEAYRLAREITIKATVLKIRSPKGAVAGFDESFNRTFMMEPGPDADELWADSNCIKLESSWEPVPFPS